MVEVSRIMRVVYNNRRDWCLISFWALGRGLYAKYQSLLLNNRWLNQAVLKCCFVGWIQNYGGIEYNVKHLSSLKTVGKDVISIFAFRSWFEINRFLLIFLLPAKRFRTLNAVWSAKRFVLGPVVLLMLWPTVAHGPALRTQNRHGAFTHRTPVTRNHAAHPEMSAKWTLKDMQTRCFLKLNFRLVRDMKSNGQT